MIRDATEADLPAIVDITNHAILHTTALWTNTPATIESRGTWLRERQAAGLPVLVSEEEGAVQGFASYGIFRPFEGYLYSVEHSVYVATEAHGRGLGRALLASVIAHAQSAGKHVMIGAIEADNTVSLRLHASLGFVETGRLAQVGRKFDRWLDLVFMQLMLQSAQR
jgi:phosphinothricin acetyltransferase